MPRKEHSTLFSNLNKMAASSQLKDVVSGTSILKIQKKPILSSKAKREEAEHRDSDFSSRSRPASGQFLEKEDAEKFIRKNRKVLTKLIENPGNSAAKDPTQIAFDSYLVEETKNMRLSQGRDRNIDLTDANISPNIGHELRDNIGIFSAKQPDLSNIFTRKGQKALSSKLENNQDPEASEENRKAFTRKNKKALTSRMEESHHEMESANFEASSLPTATPLKVCFKNEHFNSFDFEGLDEDLEPNLNQPLISKRTTMVFPKNGKEKKAKVVIVEPDRDEISGNKEKISASSHNDVNRRKKLQKAFTASEFESGDTEKKRKTVLLLESKLNFLTKFGMCKKAFKDFFFLLVSCLELLKIKAQRSFIYVVVTETAPGTQKEGIKHTKTILLPGSFIRELMDLVILCASFFTLITVPIYISFEITLTNSYKALSIFICLLHFIDIILNLRTAYVNLRGVLEVYPTKIVKRYVKYFLIMDLIPIVPIVYSPSGANRLIYAFKLINLSRVIRVANRFSEFTRIPPGIIRLLKSVFFLFLIWHWIACLYWLFAKNEDFPSNSWGPPRSVVDCGTLSHQYAYSYYFAITVTSGVSFNNNPQTGKEVIFTVALIVVGVFMYGFLMGSAISALMSMDEEDSEMRKQLDALNNFMRKKKISLDLQGRIQENVKYQFSSNQTINVNNLWFMQGVHPLLKMEATLHINKKYLDRIPIFKNLLFECQIALLSILESKIFLPEEFVVYENQRSEEMYFIQSGILEVKDRSRGVRLRLLEGDFFGEQAVLFSNFPKFSVKSVIYSELLIMRREGLIKVLAEFEEFGKSLFRYLRRKATNQFKTKGEEISRWGLLALLLRIARNIRRINCSIELEDLFFESSKPPQSKTNENAPGNVPQLTDMINSMLEKKRKDIIEDELKAPNKGERPQGSGQEES